MKRFCCLEFGELPGLELFWVLGFGVMSLNSLNPIPKIIFQNYFSAQTNSRLEFCVAQVLAQICLAEYFAQVL